MNTVWGLEIRYYVYRKFLGLDKFWYRNTININIDFFVNIFNIIYKAIFDGSWCVLWVDFARFPSKRLCRIKDICVKYLKSFMQSVVNERNDKYLKYSIFISTQNTSTKYLFSVFHYSTSRYIYWMTLFLYQSLRACER